MSKIEQGFSRKTTKSNRNNSRLKYNEWDDAGIEMQVANNHKLLILLREQFQYLKARLTKCEQSDHKIKCQNQIAQTKQNIAKMKLFLLERKRKNVLSSKKISEITKKDMNKVFFDLQQDYVTLRKKKQQYIRKIDKINEDNANLIEDHSRSQDRCIELKRQAIQILTNLPNQFQQEHNKVMYDTKCRKMQLSLRKRQRDEENYKRKYYGLLKDYQMVIEHLKQLDQKLRKIMQNTQRVASNVKSQQNRIQQIKSQKNEQLSRFRMWKAQVDQQKEQKNHNQEKQQQEQEQMNNEGFMLTQLSNKKTTSRATKRKSIDKNRYKTEPSEIKPKSRSEYNSRQPVRLAPLKISTEQYILDQGYHQKDNSSRGQSLKNSGTSDIFINELATQKSTRRNKPIDSVDIRKQQQSSSQIQQQIQCSGSFEH